jgi:zinc transport system permease protein
MHGALLGGAIALAANINPFWTTILVNLLLVWFMAQTARSLKTDMGYVSIFIMVASMGVAFALISLFNVQAKDTMSLLWVAFCCRQLAIGCFYIYSLAILAFHFLFYRQLISGIFLIQCAYSSGVNEVTLYTTLCVPTALTVAFP